MRLKTKYVKVKSILEVVNSYQNYSHSQKFNISRENKQTSYPCYAPCLHLIWQNSHMMQQLSAKTERLLGQENSHIHASISRQVTKRKSLV